MGNDELHWTVNMKSANKKSISPSVVFYDGGEENAVLLSALPSLLNPLSAQGHVNNLDLL